MGHYMAISLMWYKVYYIYDITIYHGLNMLCLTSVP